MGFLRRGAVAALVLVLATGCSTSPGAGQPGAGERTSGTGAGNGTGRGSGNATGGPGGSGTASPGGSGSPNATRSAPKDYISSFAHDDGTWGCAMRPGEFCRVSVQGAYFLKASNVGGIQILAFENGSPAPAEESVIRTVPAGGSQYNAVFGYRIGRDARTFAIQAYLKDDRGIVVAKSKQQTFTVTG